MLDVPVDESNDAVNWQDGWPASKLPSLIFPAQRILL